MPSEPGWLAVLLLALDWVIRLGLSLRVLWRRLPVGVALAWLILILAFPLLGWVAYLAFGEARLGTARARRTRQLHPTFRRLVDELGGRELVDEPALPADAAPLTRLAEAAGGLPVQGGNTVELIDGADTAFPRLLEDINAAQRSCELAFYIVDASERAGQVLDALAHAAQRGVRCRLLVDTVGSAGFLGSPARAALERSGVEVRAALPVGAVRALLVRLDLRLHRKVVVIDGEVGYLGSMNLVDPRGFKKDAGVGEWVDALVRVRGPAVGALRATFLEDWALDSDRSIDSSDDHASIAQRAAVGTAAIQIVPSGPAQSADAIEGLVLTAIYRARSELVLTTPYFVPDESIAAALASAAQRGVAVTLVVPERCDSRLAGLAAAAALGDLAEAGVRVCLFRGGLLHTKSITVDGAISLFGSLNLDPRSFRLNFELTALIPDPAFTAALRALQRGYEDRSEPLELASWRARSRTRRLAEDAARLLGPLL